MLGPPLRRAHQREVAGMQRPHGRHQSHAFACRAGARNCRAQGRKRPDHRWSGAVARLGFDLSRHDSS